MAAVTASSLFWVWYNKLCTLGLRDWHLLLQILSSWGLISGLPFLRSLQRCLIALKSGLWLGHSKLFTALSPSHSCLCSVLWVIVILEGDLRPGLRSWVLWNRFSLRKYLYFAPFRFPQTLNSLPVLKTPQQHDAVTTMLHCWYRIGQVMSSPDIIFRIEAKQFNLFLSHHNLVPPSLIIL